MNKIIFIVAFLFLQGCASSDLSRSASNEADDMHLQTSNLLNNPGEGSAIIDYQNASQTAKGVFLGGGVGAAVGSMTSSIGLLGGAAGGAIFGGALGAYIDSHTTLRDKLENRGVRVIVLGDQILLVLPSATIFQGMTPRLRPESYYTLNQVAELISGYPNITVKVAANVTMAGPSRINRVVSQQQADTIVKYLWQQGIDTRLLYAIGEGDQYRVTKDTFDSIASDNYRVEITLEKLPV
ncbi:MAG TPA: OmpA family protein [Gammaproteobacteria bacterium]|nr:OmpA family protein [Gammaproteobacteria bacterium]